MSSEDASKETPSRSFPTDPTGDEAPANPGPDAGRLRRRFVVSGRVQGVGFRWWARREFRVLGIDGTAENLSDGTVVVEVEGPADALARLREKLEHGPSSARVERVVESSGPARS